MKRKLLALTLMLTAAGATQVAVADHKYNADSGSCCTKKSSCGCKSCCGLFGCGCCGSCSN